MIETDAIFKLGFYLIYPLKASNVCWPDFALHSNLSIDAVYDHFVMYLTKLSETNTKLAENCFQSSAEVNYSTMIQKL